MNRSKKVKKIITFIISITMVMTAVPASAAVQQISGAESYGELDKLTGIYSYNDPGVTVPQSLGKAKLPEKYDLRDEGRSTSVKDQKDKAFCWAFSAIASLESNIITKGLASNKLDLSEAHLAYYGLNGERNDTISKFGGRDTCVGSSGKANYYNATAALARGYGAVSEANFPFSAYLGDEPEKKYVSDKLMTKSTYQLDDAVFVSADPKENDYDKPAVNTVKKLIMKNGAVSTRMVFPDDNDGLLKQFGEMNVKKLKAFYGKEEDLENGGGHAITIIGWDDTYNDFPSAKIEGGNKPAGPGAWIIKDSYGTDLHGDGYFYMSYYTASLYQYVSFQGERNEGRLKYQYDGIGVGEGMLNYKAKVNAANTYKARTDLMLDQLASYTPSADCRTNFKVYINQDGKNPTSGIKAYDRTFTKKYAGYSRTKLNDAVAIPKGTLFSIVVTTRAMYGGKYYAPFEVLQTEDPIQSPAGVRPGQTYFKITGKTAGSKSGKWQSVTYKTFLKDEDGEKYQLFNALAKGFAMECGVKAQKIQFAESVKMKKGKKLDLKAKITKGSGDLIYRVLNPKFANVSEKGVVTAKKKGTAKIAVYATPTSFYRSAKEIVEIKIK